MASGGSLDQLNLDPPLRGVRGWLLGLCLFLLIGSPVMSALSIAAAWQGAAASPALGSLLTSQAVIEIVLLLFAVYAGWALYRVRPNAVKVATAYFHTVLALNLFVLSAVLYSVFIVGPDGAALAGLRGPAAAAAVRQIIVCAAWLVYLGRSLRVQATYLPA